MASTSTSWLPARIPAARCAVRMLALRAQAKRARTPRPEASSAAIDQGQVFRGWQCPPGAPGSRVPGCAPTSPVPSIAANPSGRLRHATTRGGPPWGRVWLWDGDGLRHHRAAEGKGHLLHGSVSQGGALSTRVDGYWGGTRRDRRIARLRQQDGLFFASTKSAELSIQRLGHLRGPPGS